MKQKIIHCCAGVLISILCAGCNESKQDPEPQGVDVPFTEYSFTNIEASGEEISDFRINPSYFFTRWGEGKIFIINSGEELKKYVEGDCPLIDFSTQTLLLVGGGSTSSPVTKAIRSFRLSADGRYELEVEISQGVAAFGEGWRMAILTDKMSNDSEIKLNIITLGV